MNVDFMRKVDYFVGVPLCFAGTMVRKLSALMFAPKTSPGPRSILLIELSEMGSTILADPAMQKLKRELNANLFFAIFRKYRPSLELLGTVPGENIYTIDESSFSSFAADAIKFFSGPARKVSIRSSIWSSFSGSLHCSLDFAGPGALWDSMRSTTRGCTAAAF